MLISLTAEIISLCISDHVAHLKYVPFYLKIMNKKQKKIRILWDIVIQMKLYCYTTCLVPVVMYTV